MQLHLHTQRGTQGTGSHACTHSGLKGILCGALLTTALLMGSASQTMAQGTEQLEAQIADKVLPQNNFYVDGDHSRLAVELLKPELRKGQKCPVVVFCHGFGAGKEWTLYYDIIKRLNAAGIAAVLFDFNGHGLSEGRFEDMTVPNEVSDLKHIVDYVKAQPFCNGSISLVGHSQGGVVAGMGAGEMAKEIKSVVLLAPAAVLREDAIRGNTFGSFYDPLNPPEVIELMGGRLKLGGNYVRTAFTLPIYETSQKYKGPALLVHGTGDRIAPYSYSERYHGIWAKSELQLLDGDDHGFSKQAAKVVDLTSEFLIKQVGKKK